MNSLSKSVEIIKNHLKVMPNLPGIYKMIDKDNNIIYVGKAKDLAKRVINYTRPQNLEYRIQVMISNILKIEIITTETETEALLLESNLIKKHEPRYNILLKDDKTYPYILITENHDFPRISKHRGLRKLKGKYFGPFTSAYSVNKSISDLQKSFLLRPCTDSYFANRKRPCLEYQIKRCSAPCTNIISKNDYQALVKQALDFLEGKSRNIQNELIKNMETESAKQNYEKATIYRDRIKALNQIQKKQNINIESLNDADVIALYFKGGKACVQIFFYRNGHNYGSNNFFPKNIHTTNESDILNAFICQYYTNNNIPPKDIIVSHEISDKSVLEEYFLKYTEHKVNIKHPKLGAKKKLIDEATINAKNSLNQNILLSKKQSDLLKRIADVFEMKEVPKHIEVYDNSHISGKHQVGAMIVADQEGFNKKKYRQFNIKSSNISAGDDYSMLAEVLTRRFKKLQQHGDDDAQWPDLVLIDGGAGHLTIASKIFSELNILDKFTFVCISKGPQRNSGRENFHILGKEQFTLDINDPAMHYLQILRDEAHRFAIGSHRKKRAKSVTKSEFDEIPNIGPKRKKLLLNHFGSLKEVKEARLEELKSVDGIDIKIAQLIFEWFK